MLWIWWSLVSLKNGLLTPVICSSIEYTFSSHKRNTRHLETIDFIE
jgi:hypothetical protein